MSTVTKWRGIDRATPEFLTIVVQRAREKGWDANALLGQISHESSFNPAAKNPSGSASGLIQMLDSVARRYAGMSALQLRETSALNQIPGIFQYYDVGRPLQGSDFLMLGISRNPSLLDAPDVRVIYPTGSRAAELNPLLQDAQGAISVGGIKRHWANWESRNPEKIELPEVTSQAGFPLFFGIVVLGAYAALRRTSRK